MVCRRRSTPSSSSGEVPEPEPEQQPLQLIAWTRVVRRLRRPARVRRRRSGRGRNLAVHHQRHANSTRTHSLTTSRRHDATFTGGRAAHPRTLRRRLGARRLLARTAEPRSRNRPPAVQKLADSLTALPSASLLFGGRDRAAIALPAYMMIGKGPECDVDNG